MKQDIELNDYTKELNNLEIWGVCAGFGSRFYLHIGKKIKRETPVQNEYLSELLTDYEGFYVIGVTCAWRLEKNNKVVLSHIQDEEVYITPTLEKLEGAKILSINEISNNMGLNILMNNGITLTLFYDNVKDYNWILFKNKEFYFGVKEFKYKNKE